MGIKNNQLWYVDEAFMVYAKVSGLPASKSTGSRYYRYLLVPVTNAQKKRLGELQAALIIKSYNAYNLESQYREAEEKRLDEKDPEKRRVYAAEVKYIKGMIYKAHEEANNVIDKIDAMLYGPGKSREGRGFTLSVELPANRPEPFNVHTTISQSDIDRLPDHKLTPNAKPKAKLTRR